jgi:hypothetical protein
MQHVPYSHPSNIVSSDKCLRREPREHSAPDYPQRRLRNAENLTGDVQAIAEDFAGEPQEVVSPLG